MKNDMKIWLVGDTHFGYKGDDDEWLNDYAGYFEDVIIPLMKDKVGPNDMLIHCGDVFDNRSTVGLNTLTRVVSLFEKLSSVFNDIRIVVGNHDIAKKHSNDVTGLHAIKYIPNVKVYFNPEVDTICGKRCLFNPWIEDVEKEKELLEGVDVDYVFGHLAIGGSRMTDRKGISSEVTGGVPAGLFKNAQVYAGHIHIRQDKKNIHYVGNPYHKDRGDRDNIKGITVLDIATGETEFIENTTSPRYMKENIYDIAHLTVADLKKRWNNNRIDLHMKSSDYQVCSFDSLKDCLNTYFKAFNPIGDGDCVELDTSNSDIEFGEPRTSDDYVCEFIDQQEFDPKFRKWVDDKMNEYKERLC